MKKVLVISPTGTLDNGAEISVINLMTFLKSHNYQVFNVFPSNPHPSQDKYIEKMKENGILFLKLPLLNWWWEESPAQLHGTKEERFYFYQKYIYDIRQYIKENNIDIVITNTANLFQGAVAAACENRQHFWLIHEFPAEEFAYYKDYIPFMADMSDDVFSVEGILNEQLATLFPQEKRPKTFMPYSNIDQSPVTSGTARRLISIGKINDNKNQIELLKAYIALNQRNLPLVFIGGWEESVKEKLDAIIKENELTNVQFLGHKANPWEYVTDQDVCVFNSKSESYSMVFVEATLKGIPTVVSDNYGYQSVQKVFKSGHSYPLGNIDKLVQLLKSILEDYEEYKTRSLYLQQKARQVYTLENAYASILKAIATGHPSTKKIIYPIKELLGSYNYDEFPWFIHNQKLTIFESEELDSFSAMNSHQKELAFSDDFMIEISDQCNFIRFDLSEQTGISAQISLYDAETKQFIKPLSYNAILENDVFLFLTQDPQMIYDVHQYHKKTLQFRYTLTSTYDSMVTHTFDQITRYQSNDIMRLESDISELTTQILSLQRESQNWKNQYLNVINSRRWTIPTKIINFFRRKK